MENNTEIGTDEQKGDNVVEKITTDDQPGEIYHFRFRGENLACPQNWIEPVDILFLALVDRFGWSFYSKLKVDYNYFMPRPLENLIAFYCIHDEIEL